ncbi:DUF4433 domain-containing protein [Bacillus sp. FSL W8-0183]|uniref:DUF4433 domain-containing protein n=1 Tax=Bacillus sp. FSL W8-0183 TaxID=2954568 RepID=UPI0030FB10AF
MAKNKSEFAQVIDDLITGKIQTGLPSPKMSRIPKYVYHFTDIGNAVNILKEGFIYSRNSAIKKSIMKVDNASATVIQNTENNRKDYVRFYFRPKTPTQYRNEGVRAINQISSELKAHCPVPVFFLFDSYSMLTLENSFFTYGNFANYDTKIYNDSLSFRNMPFNSVYHESYYDSSVYPDMIKFHRHAELIVPDKCDLTFLKRIVCRSEAEKETFINLLDESLKSKFKHHIIVDTKGWFFNSTWTFIERVNMTSDRVTFSFNVNKEMPAFSAKFYLKDLDSNQFETWSQIDYRPIESQTLTFSKPYKLYSTILTLDDHIVYKGNYTSSDSIPY